MYQVKFIWNQTVLSENNKEFTLERMTCNFITDLEEFEENNINQAPTPTNTQISISQENPSFLSNYLK
ncbi:hypothetical protein GLOIN_2v1763616 [Rhizophagus irregularis DAOM 181602=DAOM 197198]|nr:hypothetical protein GLOIN_2v1763616 [Rhizophagus irregularis DAOM 181602=DAOM 197198]